MLVAAALVALAFFASLWFSHRGSQPVVAGEWSYTQFLRQVDQGGVSLVRVDPDEGRLLVVPADRPIPRVDALPATSSSTLLPPDLTPLSPSGLDVIGALGNRLSRPSAMWPPGVPVYAVLLPSGVPSAELIAHLDSAHVDFGALPTNNAGGFMWLATLLPTLVTVAFLGFMIWSIQRNQAQPANLPPGRLGGPRESRFKRVDPADNTTRLADLAGMDEVKDEAAEFITFLKEPSNYRRVNAKMTRGVLLVGPPGTGKTMLARAIAGEAGVPFFAVSGSEFVEMFVGVGAARVRELFAQAKLQAPSIVFIDEIDGVGRQRGGSAGGNSNDEREQTLNQLLVEMDGFVQGQDVIVMAASNRPDVLDKALLRPGRFDRQVHVDLPDRAARIAILQAHTRKSPLAKDVNLDAIARSTPGFSGAELANIVNEAALLAARRQGRLLTQACFHEARDKVMMGAERKNGIKNMRERKVVAYHEAGHAIVARFDPLADPVHKITIIPRGRSLGLTAFLPDEESFNHSADMLRSNLRGLMGGRAAEDVALNTMTVGAGNDFHRATQLARRMVGSWGMDPSLGTISFDGEQGAGSAWGQQPLWSEHWLTRMNDRVVAEVSQAYQHAVATLNAQRVLLDAVAQALLKDETLDDDAFEQLVQAHGHQPPPLRTVPAVEPTP